MFRNRGFETDQNGQENFNLEVILRVTSVIIGVTTVTADKKNRPSGAASRTNLLSHKKVDRISATRQSYHVASGL